MAENCKKKARSMCGYLDAMWAFKHGYLPEVQLGIQPLGLLPAPAPAPAPTPAHQNPMQHP